MNEGKRGPNGGVIDLDDPCETFPPGTRQWLAREINGALRLAEKAAVARMQGYEGNAAILSSKATRRLTDAIWATLEERS